MTDTKQDQIIFLKGKEKALKSLFSEGNFGYLALGYREKDNGFMNETATTSNGFSEITEPTYQRVKLTPLSDVVMDETNGKVTIRLVADIDSNNIISHTIINQMAIVDNASKSHANTVFYCAATFSDFPKSEQTALGFDIEIKL